MSKEVTILCVLKKSNKFDVDYVERLKAQINEFAPDVPFVCLSSNKVPCKHILLRKSLPGWWSKMEMFRPDIKGDIFYLDLDTIITGQFYDLLGVGELTMLADPFRPEELASGLMYVPEDVRSTVWDHWKKAPTHYMQKYRKGGDQAYLRTVFGNKAKKWQELFPGRVISYKADKVYKNGVPEKASIVCFQGRPKPRDIGWDLGSDLPKIRKHKK